MKGNTAKYKIYIFFNIELLIFSTDTGNLTTIYSPQFEHLEIYPESQVFH